MHLEGMPGNIPESWLGIPRACTVLCTRDNHDFVGEGKMLELSG
jgi:hypothetical protein